MSLDFAAVAEEREPLPEIRTIEYSIESVKTLLKARYDADIDAMVSAAGAHKVVDDDSEKLAVEMGGQAKKLARALDVERKRIIEEPGQFVKDVNGLCKTFSDRLTRIETLMKAQISDFQRKKKLDRLKREKAAQEAAEKLRKQIEKEAKKAGVEAPPVEIVVPVEKKETVTRADTGASAHMRTEWKMTKVEDFARVPDEYKELNMKMVNAAIKAGIRNVPGLKIEEVATTVLRT